MLVLDLKPRGKALKMIQFCIQFMIHFLEDSYRNRRMEVFEQVAGKTLEKLSPQVRHGYNPCVTCHYIPLISTEFQLCTAFWLNIERFLFDLGIFFQIFSM